MTDWRAHSTGLWWTWDVITLYAPRGFGRRARWTLERYLQQDPDSAVAIVSLIESGTIRRSRYAQLVRTETPRTQLPPDPPVRIPSSTCA